MRERRRQSHFRILATAGVVLLGVSGGMGCQVPVFRFALERWEPDPYTIAVVTAGEMNAEEKKAMEFLENSRKGGGVALKIERRTDDETGNSSGGARLELYYPQEVEGLEVRPVWSGPLNMANAGLVVESPARREIVKRLLAGQSATWVIVRSGDREMDKAAVAAMNEFVEASSQVLRIPAGIVGQNAIKDRAFHGDPDNVLRSDLPLKIDFSFLEIDRDDPAEAVFLAMLLNVEDDLGDFADEPMAFPVFGRGRVLGPLIGDGIDRDNALDYAGYLCEPCSCQVKKQNPGLDLLVTADWKTALEGNEVVEDKVLPPLEGTGALASLGETGATTDETATPGPVGEVAAGIEEENDGFFSSIGRSMGITAGIVVLLIALGSLALVRRTHS